MSFTGFVNAGLQLGISSIVITPQRRGIVNPKLSDGSYLEDIVAQATIEERHKDELEVTEHPVEQGAAIADHAFKRPAEVILHLGWSNSPSVDGGLVNSLLGFATAANSTVLAVADVAETVIGVLGLQSTMSGAGVRQIQSIYAQLLKLQESRALFDLYTGKRFYSNMICKSLSTETDFKSANSLPITMTCRQVILVNTQTIQLSSGKQASPEITSSPVNNGTTSLQPSAPLSA